MIRIAINGANGRMGKEVIALLADDGEVEVAETVDKTGRTSSQNFTEVDPERIDGVIDFSSPSATVKLAKWCAQHKKFLVSGTTGLSINQKKILKNYARKTAILWAPNLSLGVAALRAAIQSLGHLPGFDFQIEEIHHRHKKDSPSGTALALQSDLKSAIGRTPPPPLAIRGGGVRGVHRVYAMGEGEVLCFEHVAMDRAIFARGAIAAAKFLKGKNKGLFGLEDLWPKSAHPQS